MGAELEAARILLEDQMAVINEQKAQKLRDIERDEADELGRLRQARDNCAPQGDAAAATCTEDHEMELDRIRTMRDNALEGVRVQAKDDEMQVRAEAKDELITIQSQLKMQLKNLREQRYNEIEAIMRRCEGGAALSTKACKAHTVEDACAVCETGQDMDPTTSIMTQSPESENGMEDNKRFSFNLFGGLAP